MPSQNALELKMIDDICQPEQEDVYIYIFGDESDAEEDYELKPIGTAASLLTETVVGKPEKHIGEYTATGNHNVETKLNSTKQETLKDINNVFGSKQLTRTKI